MAWISDSRGARWLSLALLFLLMLSSCATSPPRNPDNLCAIFQEHRHWHRAAQQAQQRWKTSMPLAMAILYQESAFEHDARPARTRLLGFIPWKRPSSAYGYSQALDGTWKNYQRATGESWRKRTNFADAVDFVHWHMSQARERNGVGRDDGEAQYLNYHEGFAGYRRKSWQKKRWLQSVAAKVHQRSQRYARQYPSCRDSLKPGFWERLWGAESINERIGRGQEESLTNVARRSDIRSDGQKKSGTKLVLTG